MPTSFVLLAVEASPLAGTVLILGVVFGLVGLLLIIALLLPRPPQQVINPGDLVKAVALDLAQLPPEANVDPVIVGRVRSVDNGELHIESDGHVFKCLREGAVVMGRMPHGVHTS